MPNNVQETATAAAGVTKTTLPSIPCPPHPRAIHRQVALCRRADAAIPRRRHGLVPRRHAGEGYLCGQAAAGAAAAVEVGGSATLRHEPKLSVAARVSGRFGRSLGFTSQRWRASRAMAHLGPLACYPRDWFDTIKPWKSFGQQPGEQGVSSTSPPLAGSDRPLVALVI